MSAEEILRVINISGVLGLLVLIIVGGAKRIWVFGWQYRELYDDRERWRDTALKSVGVGQSAVDIAQTAAQAAALATAMAKTERADK